MLLIMYCSVSFQCNLVLTILFTLLGVISKQTNPSAPLELQAKQTLDVNYFGMLNVCDELFPLLKRYSRVVNMSSGLGKLVLMVIR